MSDKPHRLFSAIGSRGRAGVVGVLLILAAGGGLAWHIWLRPAVRAGRWLTQARRLRISGDWAGAERSAATALDLDPARGDAAVLAAECAAASGEFRRAVDYARRTASSEPGLRLRAALIAARLNAEHLHRLADAEESYRAALALDPDNVEANSGISRLLGLCGRAREAVPHILRILRQGEPTDLLVLLAHGNGAVSDADALDAARRADSADPSPLLGLAWRAAADENPEEAIRLLREALRLSPGYPAVHAALGKQLLAAGRLDELVDWARRLPPAADEFPDTWLVRARMAENGGDVPGAIRCFWEVVRRAPESKSANFHLARLLAENGRGADSERFGARVRQLTELETIQNRALFSSDRNSVGPLLELAESFQAAGRLWEAYGWRLMAANLDPADQDARRRLSNLRLRVDDLPLRITVDAANPAMAVDLSRYPLPRWKEFNPAPVVAGSGATGEFSFRDDAAAAGLRFRYDNGAVDPPAHRMFEFTGGGIAVLDFDLDGFADVFFTQGGPWPPEAHPGGPGDRIFHNLRGRSFEDVTLEAGIVRGGFGQGAAVGDINADGFPDLYAAHIGANRLWANNGDGTFADVTEIAGVAGDRRDWTTSCVLADLNSDGLPDIYAANYVTAEDVFDRVCRHADGSAKICMPFDFDGQPDHLWLNDGRGGFILASADALSVAESGKGLGLAVWDAQGKGRLSLLVANDTTPNFFFVPETGSDGRTRLRDRAIEAGLAFNGEGKAKGCMGIALGDVNDDGRLDVHITNFLGEANTFYMGLPECAFEDRTRETGLHQPTLDVLGFGTQFLDVDLDGRLELFMANGHIDDFRKYGKPYRMPPLLFRWVGSRFQKVDAAGLGPYFRQNWLGRAVARVDWNRDGRDDLVVGHLADDSALLTNTTRDAGNFLSIRLFGVKSNRDALGTVVSARFGERTIYRQLTAGDGYQASNERRLILGVGSARQVDELTVHWPSGQVQQFTNVSVSQEVWLPEGRALVVPPPAD